MDRAAISVFEHGRRDPNLRTVLKLARALGVPPAMLLNGVEPSDAPLKSSVRRSHSGARRPHADHALAPPPGEAVGDKPRSAASTSARSAPLPGSRSQAAIVLLDCGAARPGLHERMQHDGRQQVGVLGRVARQGVARLGLAL